MQFLSIIWNEFYQKINRLQLIASELRLDDGSGNAELFGAVNFQS